MTEEKPNGTTPVELEEKGDLSARIFTWILGAPKRPPRSNTGMRFRACEKCANSVGVINVVASGFLMVLKGYLGVTGNSTALIADAVHSGADLIAATMLLIGLKVAKRPADKKYPYGYGKVEYLIAVVIYASLIFAAIFIFIDAIDCIVHKACVAPSAITLVGAFLAVIVNEMMFRQSYCAGTQLQSPSMIANAFEKRSDALTSIAVFVGIAGSKLGFHFFDPAAAILVGFYIMKLSIEMLSEAFKGLLDSSIEPEVVNEIHKVIQEVDGIKEIEKVRTREIGQSVWVDLELRLVSGIKVNQFGTIENKVRQVVAKTIGRPSKIEIYLKGTI